MDSGVRKDVVRRVWLVLCGLECCSFVCDLAISILMAKMYIHFLPEPETPGLSFVIWAIALGWSALLCPLLYWRWIFQTATRLRLFLVAVYLGDGIWAFCIVALLHRGFCISPGSYSCGAYRTVENLHVSVKRFHRLSTLTMIQRATVILGITAFNISCLALILSAAYFREIHRAIRLYGPAVCKNYGDDEAKEKGKGDMKMLFLEYTPLSDPIASLNLQITSP